MKTKEETKEYENSFGELIVYVTLETNYKFPMFYEIRWSVRFKSNDNIVEGRKITVKTYEEALVIFDKYIITAEERVKEWLKIFKAEVFRQITLRDKIQEFCEKYSDELEENCLVFSPAVMIRRDYGLEPFPVDFNYKIEMTHIIDGGFRIESFSDDFIGVSFFTIEEKDLEKKAISIENDYFQVKKFLQYHFGDKVKINHEKSI